MSIGAVTIGPRVGGHIKKLEERFGTIPSKFRQKLYRLYEYFPREHGLPCMHDEETGWRTYDDGDFAAARTQWDQLDASEFPIAKLYTTKCRSQDEWESYIRGTGD